MARPTKAQSLLPPICYKCGTPLFDDNWYPSQRRAQHRICKTCHQKQNETTIKRFRALHPDSNRMRLREFRKRGKGIEYMKKIRTKALERIGPLRCVYCGQTDLRVLEINHKNGGGTKEFHSKSTYTFYKGIISGTRKADDLEITCSVCNKMHYLKLKYGLEYKIAYVPSTPSS